MINSGEKLGKALFNIFEYVFEDVTKRMVDNGTKEDNIMLTKNEDTGKFYIKKIVIQEIAEEEYKKEIEKVKK